VKLNGLPSFGYEGGSGFQCVKVALKPGESVEADAGCMNYMDNSIEINTQTGNLGTAFGRLFSGSSFFYNTFTNKGKKSALINLSSVHPGNIGAFYLPKGQKINIVSSSYICSTNGLEISTNVRFGGLVLGYGLTFIDIEAKDRDGIVWASSFGNAIEKIISPGDSIKVDNGILMAFERDEDIHTNFVGGIKSTLFSGEGLVSKIENKGKESIRLWLQSRSQTAYLKYIKSKISRK
jgi:uncharacterized protein (TIGR00266 family)